MLKLRRKYHLYALTIDEVKAWDRFLRQKGIKIKNFVQDKIARCYVINFSCTDDELNMKQVNADWNYGWY